MWELPPVCVNRGVCQAGWWEQQPPSCVHLLLLSLILPGVVSQPWAVSCPAHTDHWGCTGTLCTSQPRSACRFPIPGTLLWTPATLVPPLSSNPQPRESSGFYRALPCPMAWELPQAGSWRHPRARSISPKSRRLLSPSNVQSLRSHAFCCPLSKLFFQMRQPCCSTLAGRQGLSLSVYCRQHLPLGLSTPAVAALCPLSFMTISPKIYSLHWHFSKDQLLTLLMVSHLFLSCFINLPSYLYYWFKTTPILLYWSYFVCFFLTSKDGCSSH